jgi:hypothetical protein
MKSIIMSVVLLIIIIIVILIILSLRSKKEDDHPKTRMSNNMVVQKSFTITVGDKTAENRLLDKGSKQAFYIDDIEAPQIYLKRNVYYEFKNLSDEPFYFTSDAEGGYKLLPDKTMEEAPGSLAKNVQGGFKGLAKGKIFFFTSDDLPIEFYYQSGKHKNMGSVVYLI